MLEKYQNQTYPDDFIFYYKSLLDGYKMIGNSVPVKFTKVLSESIQKQFFFTKMRSLTIKKTSIFSGHQTELEIV